ncbi:hypothetical protein OHAE_3322 [Ochrobactrum soli]|uniref:Uncharacterized protein n=1 Tax=Ochrobactrum soli TaxID=2448455 RepID=A0A2P9HHY4_9HYPH|nr:hypothetical protein OHAE_3322 [[Ochrobactrum] soli]
MNNTTTIANAGATSSKPVSLGDIRDLMKTMECRMRLRRRIRQRGYQLPT